VIEAAAWTTLGATATVAALHLAAPVVTPRGPERRLRAAATRARNRLIPRAHPQAPYPDPDAGDAEDV